MSHRRHHSDDRHMTLKDHLKELSIRLLITVVLLLITSSLVYVFRSSVMPIILEPAKVAFGDQKLMYLNPAGGFNFVFLVSLYIGLAVIAPIIIHQLYIFIRPTLPEKAKNLSARLLLSSFVLLLGGVLFGYFIAVPGALQFLSDFAGSYVDAALTADSYLNFLVAYTLGLGLLFQLPILIVIANYIKPLTPSGLMKSERWSIVLIFIAAAIITPTPDPINLMIVALPILFIYHLGVVSVLVTNFKQKKSIKRELKRQSQPVSILATSYSLQHYSASQSTFQSSTQITASVSMQNVDLPSVSPAVKKRVSRSIDGVIVTPGNIKKTQSPVRLHKTMSDASMKTQKGSLNQPVQKRVGGMTSLV